MAENTDKTVQNVFNDFTTSSNLKDAVVQGIKLFKKEDKLQIFILSCSSILVKDLLSFETYLENRFQIKYISIVIHYQDIEKWDDSIIPKEWEDIIEYMSHKYPLTKAILKNSTITLQENKILVHLKLKGAEILMLRGFDKILEDTITNIYCKKYKVEYLDNSEEEYKKLC